jgi:predicted HTH transcriptional regulator
VVPEDRLVRRTARKVFENCATYFAEIRDSLRNIILDSEKYLSQRKLMENDTFWEDFIQKAANAKTTETQLWDFKETLNIWHVQGEPERTAAKVDFAENVASFANSTGGVLIIGVTDKREIVGVGDGRQLENRLKMARDVLANHIEYDRDIAVFRQIPIMESSSVTICLIIIVSLAYVPVGVGDGNGRYTYPVRRETGIERVPRDKVPTNWHTKKDTREFLDEIRGFVKK